MDSPHFPPFFFSTPFFLCEHVFVCLLFFVGYFACPTLEDSGNRRDIKHRWCTVMAPRQVVGRGTGELHKKKGKT
jgi:hypothetical protein